MTLADISIWVTLYPLYTDEKLKAVFLTKHGNIINWFEQLYQEKHFKVCVIIKLNMPLSSITYLSLSTGYLLFRQVAEKKFNGKKGLAALQSVASACWYPALGSSHNPSSSSAQQQQLLSPTHEVRTSLFLRSFIT